MPIRVLIVDDVEDLRTLFRSVLMRDDRTVVIGEAGDGVEAIERAQELQPDIVVLDVAMPRLDGLRAIPRLREVAPDARVMILTAFSSPVIARQALDSCAYAVVEKGISAFELADAITRVHSAPRKSGCRQTPA